MYNQKHHHFNSFYNHKFCFHITGPRNDAFEEVLRLRPKVVKTLDFSVEIMKRFKQEIPDLFLIGRLYVSPQDFGQMSGSTAADARRKGVEMAERLLREEVNQETHHVNGQPIFNAWESLNEVFPESTDTHIQRLFDEYQVAFGLKMRAEGFEPIAFNFGQGNGRGEQWLQLYPGTLEVYNYLGFHEYDWPTLDRLHQVGLNGPLDPPNLVPGVGEGRGNDGMWRALRYRRIMNEGIRQRYGDKHTVIITECGMTQGVWGGSAQDLGPWATVLTVPADIPGGTVPTPIPAEDYWQTLLWYNDELMKDDYVMGACLFVTGATGRPEWATFEHLEVITDRIFNYQQEVELPPTEPEPPVEPEPPIEPEPPTEPELPQWSYTLTTGPGLGLLVGDIGLAGETVIVTRPGGWQDRVTSGSKPEHGIGGFETYAQSPGIYLVEFLDQRFELELTGQFTKVVFRQETEPEPEPPVEPQPPIEPEPPEATWTYTLMTGAGLGLLTGDIGLAGETVTVTRPGGWQDRVTSGSKVEYGPGGFETYAQVPGIYIVEFLDQRFELDLLGMFTYVQFRPVGPAPA